MLFVLKVAQNKYFTSILSFIHIVRPEKRLAEYLELCKQNIMFTEHNKISLWNLLIGQKRAFVKNHKIITKLFLKNVPVGTQENVLLPDDVIELQ